MNDPLEKLLKIIENLGEPLPVDQLEGLSDLGSDAVERFGQTYRQLPADRRRALLLELGRIADERIELQFHALNRLALEDEDPLIRCVAIENLWEREEPQLARVLMRLFSDDPSEDVRSAAASALGRFILLGEMNELPAGLQDEIEGLLQNAFAAPDTIQVRRSCLEALGFSSSEGIGRLIEEHSLADDDRLRVSAMRAIGRSADPVWSPLVLQELSSPSPAMRKEAATAAGELEIRKAIQPLIELLEDVDDGVRDAAIWSLGQLGGEAAEEALLELAEANEDESLAALIDEALEYLSFVNGTPDFLLFDIDGPEDAD